MKKLTTYVIMVAKTMPSYHIHKGEPTQFKELIQSGLKLHTIRGNYDLWAKRFEKINRGEACLVLKEWEGRPYNSPQREIKRLYKEDGIGIEKLWFAHEMIDFPRTSTSNGRLDLIPRFLAKNDGLLLPDFLSWFKPYDLSEPLAIIHFTKFRYNQ